MSRSLALAVLVAFAPACASRSAPSTPPPAPPPSAAAPGTSVRDLASVIDSIIDAPPLHRTHWGIAVRDLRTGDVLYARNADRHSIPASNTKLVVTLVAMGTLGPDFRWRTAVEAIGGTASEPAHLVVRAAGDPTLSDRFGASSAFAILDSLAAQVAAAGVRRVTGSLLIDATRFSDERVHSAWEVGDLPFSYAPPTAAFAIDDGTFRLTRAPGSRSGSPAVVGVVGGDDLQPLDARVRTDTLGARTRWAVEYLDRRDTVRITGALPLSRGTDTLRLAVADANAYAARSFRAALRRAGIEVEEIEVIHEDSALPPGRRSGRRLVAERTSPPLTEVIPAILKPSQNWIAEQLIRTLGDRRGSSGTWSGGIDVEMRYLTGPVGLEASAVNLRDASGLSAQNLLAPNAIIDMLAHASRAPWGASYREALPTARERGGTLSARLEGLEGRVHAKTGTIANVSSLSGYLRTEDGRDLAFSIMANASGLSSAPVRDAIDAVVRVLDSTGRLP